jgi:hypothetical protein
MGYRKWPSEKGCWINIPMRSTYSSMRAEHTKTEAKKEPTNERDL